MKLKSVVVGDGGCGKTCLLYVWAKDVFPTEYVPTVFTNSVVQNLQLNGKEISLSLWDTAGQEEYDRLRPLSYPNTNVFLVCFSLVNKGSFDNARDKWLPEVKYHCPNAQYILVGTKLDVRDDPEWKEDGFITTLQGHELQKLGFYSYRECSALKKIGLKEIFDDVLACQVVEKKRKNNCKIL